MLIYTGTQLYRDNRMYKIKYSFFDNTIEKVTNIKPQDIIVLQTKKGIMLNNAPKILVKELKKHKADFIYCDEAGSYKPNWSVNTINSWNYISGITAFTGEVFINAGLTNIQPSCTYDLILRLTEKAKKIIHTNKILFAPNENINNIDENLEKKALQEHFKRIGLENFTIHKTDSNIFHTQIVTDKNPLISILIPNCDHINDLQRCVNSILNKSTYRNFEIIIIENNSKSKEIFDYYEQLKNNPLIKVLYYKGKFNYSAINNFAAKNAKGEYLLLLNNDTEVRSKNWLEELLSCLQFPNVGCVGALLSYPDKTIQHAGIVLKMQNRTAGHIFQYESETKIGYEHRLDAVQNVSAVTGACLMTKTSVYKKLGGLDEKFAVSYNDVDFCLRLQKAKFNCVFTPFAKLFHDESKSRGKKRSLIQKIRFLSEIMRLHFRYRKLFLKGDSFYSKHLPLDKTDCNSNFEKKSKIFIAMHKDYITPHNEIFETVQCGCNLTNTRLNCKHFDNCGENISAKNKNYCELTALYAMWKNGNFENCDYVGLMHYRRYLYPFNQPLNLFRKFFSLSQNSRLGKIFPNFNGQLFSGKKNTEWENPEFALAEISAFLKNEMYNFDMLIPYPEILPCSVYKNYCDCHREKDLQAMIESVETLFPAFLPYLKKVLNSHSLYIGNLFVMKKSLTDKYLSMLFTVLEDVEKKIILPTDTYQARVFGFLAERFFSAFVLYCKSKEMKIRHAWILNIKN